MPKKFVSPVAMLCVVVSIACMSGCSHRPSAEETAAQTQAAVDKAVAEARQQFLAEQAAEKAKHDAAAAEAAGQARKHEEAASKKRHLAEQPKGAQQGLPGQAMVSSVPLPPPSQPVCATCGVVLAINPVEDEGKGSGLGVIAGGVVGGLLGNQVGNGGGRSLATIAGAVGGALAGNKIEKNAKKTTSYDVTVKMDTGEQRVVRQATVPSLAIGQKVAIENGAVVKY
jgi:outer membrane lipoprotein SlyB